MLHVRFENEQSGNTIAVGTFNTIAEIESAAREYSRDYHCMILWTLKGCASKGKTLAYILIPSKN